MINSALSVSRFAASWTSAWARSRPRNVSQEAARVEIPPIREPTSRGGGENSVIHLSTSYRRPSPHNLSFVMLAKAVIQ
jgi:hypothetical protein